MSELPQEPTKRHAGYAILESDGTIIRLERNRWQADEIATRLPGRKVVDVYVTEEQQDEH